MEMKQREGVKSLLSGSGYEPDPRRHNCMLEVNWHISSFLSGENLTMDRWGNGVCFRGCSSKKRAIE